MASTLLRDLVGEEIRLELGLESQARSLSLPGIVLYAHGSGMGVRFKYVSPNQQATLKRYVQSRTTAIGSPPQSSIGEQLTELEDQVRDLKMQYEIYFNGGSRLPPADSQCRVERSLEKFSESKQLSSIERFRYDELHRRYQVLAEVWRRKIKARGKDPWQIAAELRQELQKKAAFRVRWRDPALEPEKVERLFAALIETKKRCGEDAGNVAVDAFKKFVFQKTAQLKRDFSCDSVEYVVLVEQGQVKLKARRC